MVRIIAIIFFSVSAFLALWFSLLNFQIVDINLYIASIQLPLAVALTIELVAGICIGFIVAYTRIIKLKSENRILSNQLSKK